MFCLSTFGLVTNKFLLNQDKREKLVFKITMLLRRGNAGERKEESKPFQVQDRCWIPDPVVVEKGNQS